MRNEIVRKNLIITAITLLSFFLISLFITSYFNKLSMEKQLINLSLVIKDQMNETINEEELKGVVNLYTNQQSWIEVSVINSLGTVIYHSASDELYTQISDKDLKRLDDPNDIRKTYQSGNDIYMLIKVTDDLYLRSSMPLVNESTYILNSVFFILVTLLIVFMISYIYNNNIANKVGNTFKTIETHLKRINTNEYESIEIDNQFEEAKESIKEINEISLNISKLIQTNQQERDKIKFVIDKMQQGLFVINLQNEFLLINDFAAQIFKDNQVMTPADLSPKIKKQIQLCLLNKTEIYFDCLDEESDLIYSYHLHYIDTKWGIEDEESGIVLGLMIDVTMERKNQELKAEFITNATHELKTPLTSITGFSELLSKGLVKSEEQQKEMIEKIHQVSLSMKLTVENLLFLSTLESPDTIHLKEEVFIQDVIQMSINKYQHEASAKKVTIETSLEDNTILGNTMLITYLVNNLLENAIRYNNENGKVFISNHSDEKHIYFKVKDTGKGVDKRNIAKIFEKFYRVPQEGAKGMGSTGIGLAIVARIAYIHNAKIDVESTIDIGSEFIITFNRKGEGI